MQEEERRKERGRNEEEGKRKGGKGGGDCRLSLGARQSQIDGESCVSAHLGLIG